MSTFTPAPEAPLQYTPPVEPPRKRASTAFVVWGYVLAVLLPPVGIVFGIIAIRRDRTHAGWGMVLTGALIGVIGVISIATTDTTTTSVTSDTPAVTQQAPAPSSTDSTPAPSTDSTPAPSSNTATETAPAATGPTAKLPIQNGDWRLSSVSIKDDGLGDFGGRARITYTGDNPDGGTNLFTITVFRHGKDVAALEGSAEAVKPGTAATVQLISTDKFVPGPYKYDFQNDL